MELCDKYSTLIRFHHHRSSNTITLYKYFRIFRYQVILENYIFCTYRFQIFSEINLEKRRWLKLKHVCLFFPQDYLEKLHALHEKWLVEQSKFSLPSKVLVGEVFSVFKRDKLLMGLLFGMSFTCIYCFSLFNFRLSQLIAV